MKIISSSIRFDSTRFDSISRLMVVASLKDALVVRVSKTQLTATNNHDCAIIIYRTALIAKKKKNQAPKSLLKTC